ncbi:5-formyltetrahydrofolate cyclo-ligase [Heyndrickxia sporothermodurans]|nr:5-formyltetrahydrofolate cyclo-ligase [Heyndrickxia sporothermodurans]
MDKKQLRIQLKQQLSSIDHCTYEQLSYLISKNLFDLKQFKEAKTIGITVSRFPEVDTWQLIRKCWDQGKRVAVPKCLPKTKEMVFKEITSFTQLETVYYGLYEPIQEKTIEIKKSELDLIIVPGMAFTVEGYRLGFGGGYYDRYLQNYEGTKISLAFERQIQNVLPIENHDISVNFIVTESGQIHCK